MTKPASSEPPRTPDDLDYDLPEASIAQTPAARRDDARLLVDRGDRVEHRFVRDLPELLRAGDLLVVNDSRVMPARLPLRRPTGGATEVLLLDEQPDGRWEALVKPSRKQPPGSSASDDAGVLTATIEDDLGEGRRLVALDTGGRPLIDVLDEVGRAPLPPYIESGRLPDERERYQTVYARTPGSAAAPTAGLHLTDDLLDRLAETGVELTTVELVVGLDTFRPVTAERLDDHEMHTERYHVPAGTQTAVRAALDDPDRRVVAVGTTSVRALESWAATGEPEGRTDLFIRRPYDWQVVDVLMTNFHMPRSTLLCLVDAFVGPRWRNLYADASAEGYRFLSFGDAMILGLEPVVQSRR